MHVRHPALVAAGSAALVAVFVTIFAAAASAQSAPAPAGLVAGDVSTTVTVDPASSSYSVRHTYSFSNTASDEAFTGFFEILPADARDVVATVGGAPATAVSLPVDAGFAEWLISFPVALAPDAAPLDVEVSWRVSGLIGDPDDFDRVGEGLIAIAPYAVGQVGEASLVVVVPRGYDVVEADGYERSVTESGLEFRAIRSVDEQYVALPLVVEAPDLYTRQTLDGPIEITVATPDGPSSWLGDDLGPLVEELGRWVPLDLPEAIEFRQGYTGGADLRRVEEGVFVLPFDASPAVALRAVATAWLEPLPFEDLDLRTDFAAALADRVSTSQGVAVSPRFGPWVTAMTALASVSDAEIASTVLTSLEGGVTAYGGTDDTFVADVIDWRRVTDVYDLLGGIESTADAMRLSVDADQRAELDRRDAASVDYRALEARAAPWSLPPLLRDAMATWRFDDFASMQGPVSDLIAARDEMVASAAAVDLEIGTQVQELFESADTSMDPAWERYVEQREALDHVAEALRLDTGDRGLLSTLGMVGRDADAQLVQMQELWTEGAFIESAQAAEHLVEDYESSVGRGTLRLLGPLAALVVVVSVVRRLRWRRRQPVMVDA
ncbi:MAG: hypothetical protein AAF081_07305 [Actinomycetota bacterium]